MITEKLSKRLSLTAQNPSRILIGLIFFGICLSYLGSYEFQSPASTGLVYCPLQKTWVRGAQPKALIKYRPFDDICAADTRKNSLQIELSLKTFHPITQKIVFDYLEKGDTVFAGLNQLSNLPQHRWLAQTSAETAANNSSPEISKYAFANFVLPQAARPPTFTKVSTRFAFQFVSALEKISRNIKPRSPPQLSV